MADDRSSNVDFEDCTQCVPDRVGICSNCEADGQYCEECHSTGNTTHINEMLGSIEHSRTQLEAFEANQTEDADESNVDQIDDARQGLETVENAVNYLVP
jgi:hypothetical protein